MILIFHVPPPSRGKGNLISVVYKSEECLKNGKSLYGEFKPFLSQMVKLVLPHLFVIFLAYRLPISHIPFPPDSGGT